MEEMASKTSIVCNPDYIFFRELRQNDVLLGRGTGPNEHIGNVRFRSLVRDSMQTPDFHPTPHGKSELAKKIVNTVKARNGRFVKRVSTRKNCGDTLFVEVAERVSLDKTKQSFRHQLRSSTRGDNGIKYRSMFPSSLIKSKSKAQVVSIPVAAVGKPCAPNANAASAIEDHRQNAVFNRNLNGPTILGIMDPGARPAIFVDELIRCKMGATRTASNMASLRLVDSNFHNAAQMLSSAARRGDFISNRHLLLSTLMGDHRQSGLPAPPPATIGQLTHRPAMPTLLPDTVALLDFILQGRI
jgi:hypothetical protein